MYTTNDITNINSSALPIADLTIDQLNGNNNNTSRDDDYKEEIKQQSRESLIEPSNNIRQSLLNESQVQNTTRSLNGSSRAPERGIYFAPATQFEECDVTEDTMDILLTIHHDSIKVLQSIGKILLTKKIQIGTTPLIHCLNDLKQRIIELSQQDEFSVNHARNTEH